MRIALVGTVEGSLVALEALAAAGEDQILVVTLPPERRERHSDFADLSPLARESGSEVYFTTNVNAPSTLARLRAHEPECVFVIGWSQICQREFLEISRLASIGFHPSPLPKMRGRAVIPWTILTNQTSSGSTLFWLDEGINSGPILLQKCFSVAEDETSLSLYKRHTSNLRAMLIEAIGLLVSGKAPRKKQDHTVATYCARRTAADGRIDWGRAAADVWRLVRAVGHPYPGAFTDIAGGPLIVWSATPIDTGDRYIGLSGQVQALDGPDAIVCCGDGRCVALHQVQRPGELPRAASELLRLHVRLGA